MTIVEYLNSNYSAFRYYTHSTYIEVRGNISLFPQRETVVIDQCLDLQDNCYLSYTDVVLNSTIHVMGAFSGSYNSIIPGSFIGKEIYDVYNIPMYKIYINGYVMNNGVLS